MQKYRFSLTRILPYEDRIYNSVLMRKNTGQWNPVFSHILCSVTITAGIEKYKSIIKKKKQKHEQIVLLAKSKLNRIEVSISKVLIDSNINHDEFVLTNKKLKKYETRQNEARNQNVKT